jgi:hypothetical protein
MTMVTTVMVRRRLCGHNRSDENDKRDGGKDDIANFHGGHS